MEMSGKVLLPARDEKKKATIVRMELQDVSVMPAERKHNESCLLQVLLEATTATITGH